MIKTVLICMSVLVVSLHLHDASFGQQFSDTEEEREEYVSNEIIVKFRDGISEKEREHVYKSLKVTEFKSGYGEHYHVLKIEDGKVLEMLKKCRKFKEIEYAEPNHMYYINAIPNDEFYSFQWHLPLIHLEEAWEISTGSGVTIAVIDTGVEPNGIDGFGKRLVLGRNFITRRDDSIDDNGHGTHVSGTIAQETNNGVGVAGVAPDATILAIKSFNEFGGSTTDSAVDGIRWATDNGAQVINMSFGGAPFSETMQRAVNEALRKNIVLVAASGNNGQPQISFPAAYEGVISVGAIQLDKGIAPFSNHGPDLDIVAPGGNTSKDQNDDNNSDGVLQETLFTDLLKSKEPIWNYYFLEGTSFSAPHVSGVAALILSLNPDFTPDEVRDILINTAEDLGEPGRDDKFGWGLVNAVEAVKSVK